MAEPDMDAFEARIAQRLNSFAAIPVAPVDADAVARTVVDTRRSWWWWQSRGSHALQLSPLAWVVLALAAGLLAGALIQLVRPAPAPPLVIALEDGLYVGELDPASRHRIRDDGTFILPRWSPDGARIAVLRGPPIPPQFNAGGPPLTGNPFDVRPDELLLLDANGSTLAEHPGPITDLAWGPPDDDGRSLLVVGTAAGRIVVLDDDGQVVAEWAWEARPDDDALDGDLSPPRVAWASPTRLVAGLGGDIVAFDARDGSGPAPVAGSGLPHVTAVAVRPEGDLVAFLAADCFRRCKGEVHVTDVSPPVSEASSAAPAGRRLLEGVEASTALSWSADGAAVLAWPQIVPVAGGDVRRAPVDLSPVLSTRDIFVPWARYAPDRSGRFALLNSYPAFNDRHFDAWLLDNDGRATRIAKRSLGFDLRSAGAP